MKKGLVNILAIIYIIIAIVITLCLLSYNEFDVAAYKNYVFVPIKKEFHDVNKGTLLIIEKEDDIEIDDEIYYFSSMRKFSYGTVTEVVDGSVTVNGDIISTSNVLGEDDDTSEIYILGFIYSILTSKLGYLIVVIFPVLFLFLYEIYLFSSYLKTMKDKKGGKDEKKRK